MFGRRGTLAAGAYVVGFIAMALLLAEGNPGLGAAVLCTAAKIGDIRLSGPPFEGRKRRIQFDVRTVALWVFGILAGGIFGGLIGSRLSPGGGGGVLGLLGGVFAFACARLWLAKSAPTDKDART